MLEEGKAGYVYLIDRDHLGGYRAGSNGADDTLARLGPLGAVWSTPAIWPGDGGYAYIVHGTGAPGHAGYLRVYKFGVDGDGKPTISWVGNSSDGFGFGSGHTGRDIGRAAIRLRARLDDLAARRQRRGRAAARVRPDSGRRRPAPAVERADRYRDEVPAAGGERQPRVRRNARRARPRVRITRSTGRSRRHRPRCRTRARSSGRARRKR